MRKAGIVLVTVLALTAAGALVAPAQAGKRPSRSTRAVMRT
jgi:hypothetical protein